MLVTDEWVDGMINEIEGVWTEAFGEEYGSDEESGDSGSNKVELRSLLKTWAGRAVPARTEETGEIITLTADDVRKIAGLEGDEE